MAKDNNPQFDDLFQDFFEERKNNVTENAVNKEGTPPQNKTEDKDELFDLIDNLMGTAKDQPNKANPELPVQFLQEDVPVVSQPSPTAKLNEEQTSNIEGGSSAFTLNPEVLTPRSMEVDEILSYVPNWMIRWGITTFFFILMGILAMSYFIKYPDIVEGQITVTSSLPPAILVSKTSGPLQLFKQDKAIIQQGENIALIKNDARYEDVQMLETSLEILKEKLDDGANLGNFAFPKGLDLGSLQTDFSELVFSLKDQKTKQKSSNDNFYRKANIDKQIKQITQMEKEQLSHITSLKNDYVRAKKIFENRYAPLLKNGSISAEQLDAKQSEVTQKFNSYQNAKSGLNEYRKRVLDLESQKNELDYATNQTTRTGLNAITIAYSKIKNAINSWEEQFLLTAPIDGRLNYLQFVKDNIYIKMEQEIASIVPVSDKESETANALRGELFISASGVGKVEKDQVVNIELDAYLKKEYGVILGKVAEIADVGTTVSTSDGTQTVYKVLVDFEDGLNTTSNKSISFKHNLGGKAEIITEDVRLIERIFNDLKEAFDFR